MNIISLFNMLVAISQQNHGKVTIESLKDAIDQSNMPSENKEVFKSYIDLGYDFFEECNHDKAQSECLNLMRLIDRGSVSLCVSESSCLKPVDFR